MVNEPSAASPYNVTQESGRIASETLCVSSDVLQESSFILDALQQDFEAET